MQKSRGAPLKNPVVNQSKCKTHCRKMHHKHISLMTFKLTIELVFIREIKRNTYPFLDLTVLSGEIYFEVVEENRSNKTIYTYRQHFCP